MLSYYKSFVVASQKLPKGPKISRLSLQLRFFLRPLPVAFLFVASDPSFSVVDGLRLDALAALLAVVIGTGLATGLFEMMYSQSGMGPIDCWLLNV